MVFLTVAFAPIHLRAEPETAAGEAPARTDQREPEPAKGAGIAVAGRGGECLGVRKTEVESPGAPSGAGGRAWSQGSFGIRRTPEEI